MTFQTTIREQQKVTNCNRSSARAAVTASVSYSTAL